MTTTMTTHLTQRKTKTTAMTVRRIQEIRYLTNSGSRLYRNLKDIGHSAFSHSCLWVSLKFVESWAGLLRWMVVFTLFTIRLLLRQL